MKPEPKQHFEPIPSQFDPIPYSWGLRGPNKPNLALSYSDIDMVVVVVNGVVRLVFSLVGRAIGNT